MSAVAFAAKNCALESMTISRAAMQAARDYESGRIHLDEFVTACSPSDAAQADPGNTQSIQDLGDAVFARIVLFAARPASGGGLGELRSIHGTLFGGVRSDAGGIRTHDTTSSTSAGGLGASPAAFFPAALLETGAANITSELAEARDLKCLDRPVFVTKLAHFYDELGYLHPFPYGNAMTLRIFVSRLAHSAGWDLDWEPVTRERYRDAKLRAYNGDLSGFAGMFDAITRPANPTRVFLIAGWDQGPAH
ncbi:cell division protein Fic [Bifidobacterium tissieri]|uniref:protein adenylyltransferase n=2 Tax=Bifidobacterium TaxID=1678 RepID=A0A261FG70_9BIFI|nr:cell division protein Fic [Bifidobacterium tissieri]